MALRNTKLVAREKGRNRARGVYNPRRSNSGGLLVVIGITSLGLLVKASMQEI